MTPSCALGRLGIDFLITRAAQGGKFGTCLDLLNNAQLERLAALAMQQRAEPEPPRWSAPRLTDDWRALLTEDLLSGIGEVDGEFDGEDSDLNGEDWADATTDWQALSGGPCAGDLLRVPHDRGGSGATRSPPTRRPSHT